MVGAGVTVLIGVTLGTGATADAARLAAGTCAADATDLATGVAVGVDSG
jgi:hypothetical protein